jgi:hypothetical protein
MTIRSWRSAPRLLPLLALMSAACSDDAATTAVPVQPLDDVSATAVQVNIELALMRESGFERAYRSIERKTQPVVPWLSNSRAAGADGPQTIVRHFKQSDGRILSLGLYFRKGEQLPAAIFSFENGKIRTAVGLAYVRRGQGYLRRKTRVTTFDAAGLPNGRVDLEAGPLRVSQAAGTGNGSGFLRVATDVLSFFAPRDLHAEEAAACSSEYLSYLAASIKLAAATTALQIATASCLTVPGSQPITCPAAGAAFVAFSEALDKWNLALDKLLACKEAANKSGSTTTSGGTFTSGGTDAGDDDVDGTLPIEQVVREFIDDAVADGRYVCTEDGEICTFYAE